MADSDRDGANWVALGLLAAGKVEGRVPNHLIEQGRQAGFGDLTFQLFDDFRVDFSSWCGHEYSFRFEIP